MIGSADPVRTCVGCRQRDNQSDLLRVVARGSQVLPDRFERQPGRGAYLHFRSECLQMAERRRAFSRALRVSGPLSIESVASAVQQHVMPTVTGSGDMR